MNQDTLCIFLLTVVFCGLGIFSYGFFPLSFTSNESADLIESLPKIIEDVDLDRTLYKPRFSRTVLMVIDALRRDFVQDEKYQMNYLKKLIDRGESCYLDLKVHPPTVTMPRIKALTSGTIPNFIDLVLNFGNEKMEIDNFLSQIKKGHENGIVFYGDNTWEKMFPDIFHRKGVNSDSLFVNDFYEGDKNITERLSAELVHPDWKLLILHYLGLDHIGHVEGPFSSKVPGKLEEMDKVVTKIVTSMTIWNKNSLLPSLFILTGDHGMRDTGGHGGSSQSETIVPLVITGTNCSSSQKTYNQIDISTTISVLLGLAIPHSSIGVIIPDLISDFSPEEQLYAFHYNSERLLHKIRLQYKFDDIRNQEFFRQHEKAKNNHVMYLKSGKRDKFYYKSSKLSYKSSAKEMSDLLSQSFLKYDLWSIGIGIILTGLAVLVLMFSVPFATNLTLKLDLSIRKLLVSFIVGIIFKHFICNLFPIDSDLFRFGVVTNILFLFIVFLGYICYVSLIKIVPLFLTRSRLVFTDRSPLISTTIGQFVLFVCFANLLTLAASSFIEEEHQFWYYFCNTLFIYLFIKDLNSKCWHNNEFILWRIFDKTQSKRLQEKELWYKKLEDCHDSIMGFSILIIGHLIGRKLNQTGDKWAHLRDIGDFLIEEENKMYLSLLVLFSIGSTLFVLSKFNGFLTNILTFTALILIYFFRCSTNQVSIFNIQLFTTSKMPILLFWLNILEICLIEFLPLIYRRVFLVQHQESDARQFVGGLISVFCLISCILHKPHNIILITLFLLTCNWITSKIVHLYRNKSFRSILIVITHFWIGKLFFFYQGNSNSLATVDLTAGYIGQNQFNPIIVGVFLTLNTFSGPILSVLMTIYHLYNLSLEDPENNVKAQEIPVTVIKTISIVISLPIFVYLFVVTGFRNHLFIWTVFSPKLIYEVYFFTLFYLILLVFYIVNQLGSKSVNN